LESAHQIRQDLLRSFAADEPVLSVYLPIDPRGVAQGGYAPLLMNLLRDARESIQPGDAEQFEATAAPVLDLVRGDFEPHGRTMVFFSATRGQPIEVLRLQVALPAFVRFGNGPFTMPLEAVFDDDPRIAIVAVDEREARILTSVLSEIEYETRVKDNVPGRQRQGAYSASRYERDRAGHVREHFEHVAQVLGEIDREQPFKRLVIGGAPETVSGMTDALPEGLAGKLAGSFPVQMFATDDEILRAGTAVAETAERREETELVAQIRDLALAGGAASLGWDETLQMLTEGRVHRLAIAFEHLGTERGDRALGLAWGAGSTVEFLHAEAEAGLSEEGGIGALLRY
jgi:hypothetical protein